MKKKWTMPLWMEKWIPLIGSNSKMPKEDIEWSVNQRETEYSTHDIEVAARVRLLEELHKKRII